MNAILFIVIDELFHRFFSMDSEESITSALSLLHSRSYDDLS
jgi:hypothetical protein